MNYKLVIDDIKFSKHLKERLNILKNEIEAIDYKLYGIHAGSFEDVIYKGEEYRQFYHGGYISELDKIERAESLTKLKDKYVQELQSINFRLDQVRFVMENLPKETSDIIRTIYGGKGWEYAKIKYHRSCSSLQKQIKKDIERI